MRLRALGAIACLLTVPATLAQTPLTLTPLGSVRTGPIRGEDPRIAEINAYDAAGQCIYVVNPLAGHLDVIDASNPAAPVAADSVRPRRRLPARARIGLPARAGWRAEQRRDPRKRDGGRDL
jgi:hypothetical protein